MMIKKLALITAVILFAFLSACEDGGEKEQTSEIKETKPKERYVPPEETGDLIGKWVRPDGGYSLQIVGFKDSTVDAAYFNPNPINVSETQWKIQDGYVYLYVLFDDVGYEGSYYSLGYLPEKDILMGFYYQAALKQKFEVYFERVQ